MKHNVESSLRFKNFLKFSENIKIKDGENTYLVKNGELYLSGKQVIWILKDQEFANRLMGLSDE